MGSSGWASCDGERRSPVTYILLMLMWTPSMQTSGTVSAAEFSSLEKCEAAAVVAAKTFDGWGSNLYHVCVPK